MSDEKKYCEDCQHCEVNVHGIEFSRCDKNPTDESMNRFISRQFDVPPKNHYCTVTRIAACGPDAAWFEPKT